MTLGGKIDGGTLLALIYIDDMVIFSNKPKVVDDIINQLERRFGVRVIDGLEVYQGIK
jgi:hypothetical protein